MKSSSSDSGISLINTSTSVPSGVISTATSDHLPSDLAIKRFSAVDAATEINRLVGSEIGLEEMEAAGSYEQLCAKIATAVASEISRGVMRRLRVIARLIY